MQRRCNRSARLDSKLEWNASPVQYDASTMQYDASTMQYDASTMQNPLLNDATAPEQPTVR
jgi:hypothetical protein